MKNTTNTNTRARAVLGGLTVLFAVLFVFNAPSKASADTCGYSYYNGQNYPVACVGNTNTNPTPTYTGGVYYPSTPIYYPSTPISYTPQYNSYAYNNTYPYNSYQSYNQQTTQNQYQYQTNNYNYTYNTYNYGQQPQQNYQNQYQNSTSYYGQQTNTSGYYGNNSYNNPPQPTRHWWQW